MPNPTIYLTDEELAWIESQDNTRSGVIREAIKELRDRSESNE